ncbi:MAG: phosphate/phosphite/phosphonate ABC transporter substrate-binding protein [Acidobacteriota bacterium]
MAASAGAVPPPPPPLKLGVVSFYNPRLMYLKYQPLVDYLSQRTGYTWQLAISGSYERTVEALCAGEVTLAYLGPFTFLRARERCGAEPLVRLNTGGLAEYTSLILVRRGSPIKTLADLAGKRFAFGSPLSTSSHLVPRAMLLDAGLRPGDNVVCLYLEHHERAARAVLLGQAEACGVRDLTGRKFLERGLEVLAESSPIPNFPLVLSPRAGGAIRAELLAALLEAPRQDPRVATLMAGWDEELSSGFAPASAGEYLAVHLLARRVFGPKVLIRPEAELSCAQGVR